MSKLMLASNFQDEIGNVEVIWNIFKDVVDGWVVVDSGSTDGTQQKLKDLVGEKLTLIESDMIKQNGYGYARTKLIEYSVDADWVLIFDGDERMSPESVTKLKALMDGPSPDYDMVWLPRCHFQDWEMTKVEYGSMERTGPSWREAIQINPDWQPRLIRRTMIDGKSKIQFMKRVHERPQGIQSALNSLESPVIFHFGWMKSPERLKMVSSLCDKLWQMDQQGEPLQMSYEQACKENKWSFTK